MHRYQACGLTLESEPALPGLTSHTNAGLRADAVIVRGEVPEQLEGATHVGPTWQIAGERMLLRVPGVARFLMTGGSRIEYQAADSVPDSGVVAFLIGSALGALLHQRGAYVLHGSAVAVGGRAMAFCGPSGAGKSSIVASLCAAGFPLVADDLCAITFDGAGRPWVHSDGRKLKLWRDSISALQLSSRAEAAVREGIEKYWVEPPARTDGALPLGAIHFLREARPPHVAGLDPVELLHAAEQLRSVAYRPRLVKLLDQESQWLNQSMALLRNASAYWLTRRMDFDRAGDCVETLRQHWASAGKARHAAA